MSQKNETNGSVQVAEDARSLAIAREGITESGTLTKMLSALICDVVEAKVSPSIANASVNAAGKLLKVVEMQYKYGTPKNGRRIINLCESMPEQDVERGAEIAYLESRLAELRGTKNHGG